LRPPERFRPARNLAWIRATKPHSSEGRGQKFRGGDDHHQRQYARPSGQRSRLDVVRPRRLTDKARTATYRTARGENLRRSVLISRADVAHLLLRVLEQRQTIKQATAIAY